MVESKVGISPYHQILAIYTRNVDGSLLSAFGPSATEIQGGWDAIWQPAITTSTRYTASSDPSVEFFEIDSQLAASLGAEGLQDLQDSITVEAYETKLPTESQYRGIIKVPNQCFSEETDNTAVDWVVRLLLQTSRLDSCASRVVESEKAVLTAQTITDHFSSTLRNIARGDQWEFGGRDYFAQRILHFTARSAKIELILPAFPCKSTSLDKVAGTSPDKGEELALRSLFAFVKEVEQLYEPGARVLIVSDGHVFSDCIGANDEVVDTYGRQLIEMKNALFGHEAGKIDFMGLPELFLLHQQKSALDQQNLEHIELPSYVETSHTTEADLCRRLLIAGAGIDGTALRRKIETNDKSSLALYRGFSRFMLEDLYEHPSMKSRSRAQKKKLSSKIAFEMLKRNQAYSNLVELLFPAHVRLSIHSHVNSGPKFGINLLGRFNCKATASLLHWNAEKSDDLLHVPTPWHNCMVRVCGHDGFLVVKASMVKEAVRSGKYLSEWISEGTGHGGYFLLKPVETVKKQFAEKPVRHVVSLERSYSPKSPRTPKIHIPRRLQTPSTPTPHFYLKSPLGQVQSTEDESPWTYWETATLLTQKIWIYMMSSAGE